MMSTPKKTHIALQLLHRAQSDPADATEIFKTKVLQRPLLLKPTSTDDRKPANARDSRQQARALKAQKARKRPGKPRPLSAKQKRALQIYDIPKAQRKYAIYIPLWRMWCGYIREILGIKSLDQVGPDGYGRYVEPKGAGPLLAAADFHGAKVEVVRSRCVSRVGVRGIVVRDTKFTFEVVTERDEVKVVPKEHTVFRFEILLDDDDGDDDGMTDIGEESRTEGKEKKPLVFEIHGHAFEARAPERATKRIVLHLPKDL